MEAAVLLAALVILGALARRFGVDSRDGIASKEQDLLSLGITRPDPARDAELAAALRWARQGGPAGSPAERARPRPAAGAVSRAI